MRTAIAAAAAGVFMFAATGSAPVIAAPAFEWTGAYVGVQGGYAWGETDYHLNSPHNTFQMNYDGFVGGGTAGFNRQADGFVMGAEVDISYADLNDDVKHPSTHPCAADGCQLDIYWYGTIRARLGLPLDTIMPFIAGGLAFGDVEGDFEDEVCGACYIDDTAFGWTIGGGIEWAFEERWSAKAEYLYVDLGEPDVQGDHPTLADDITTSSFNFSVVRIGINYRL